MQENTNKPEIEWAFSCPLEICQIYRLSTINIINFPYQESLPF